MEEIIKNQAEESEKEKCTKCGGRGILYPQYNNALFTPYYCYRKKPPRICKECKGTGRKQ